MFEPFKRQMMPQVITQFLSQLFGILSLVLWIGTASFVVDPSVAIAEKAAHVDASMVSDQNGIRPGRPFFVALRLVTDKDWHTYWKIPGDSGLPTRLEWDLPKGFQAGEILWPIPKRFMLEGLVNYGYEGDILHLVQITPPNDLEFGKLIELKATAKWLECEKVCIPGKEEVRIRLPVQEQPTINERWRERFMFVLGQQPKEFEGWNILAEKVSQSVRLEVTAPTEVDHAFRGLTFFPTSQNQIDHNSEQIVSQTGATCSVELVTSPQREDPLNRLEGILVATAGFDGEGKPQAMKISTRVKQTTAVWRMIFLAIVGGLILNLMPCVFPVISIKILSFMQKSGEEKSKIRLHASLFCFGLIAAFGVLAAILLSVRAAGTAAGWGFQLQNPVFVSLLGILFFWLGLSLLGVFEFGTWFTRFGGWMSNRNDYAESFFSGALAAVVSTPCTGPFMATAIGFAMTQSTPIAFIVLLTLGIGMSLPYMMFAVFPGTLNLLPKPGMWMESFKQFMAFPLFATVVWLAWVVGSQTDSDGIVWFFASLVLVGMSAWMWNRWEGRFLRFVSTLLMIGAIALVVLKLGSTDRSTPSTGGISKQYGLEWESYTPETVNRLRAEGKRIFLDFTAAWCVSCKVNEKLVFSSPEVIQKMKDLEVVPIQADWTNGDPQITKALESFGRNGVPLYVLYGSSSDSPPRILPEIITPGIFLKALDELD